MYQIELRRPGRGVIVAFIAVVVLVGAIAFGILEVRTANRLISEAKEESAAFGGQIRDSAVVFAVYRNALARTPRSRKLIDEAGSVQKNLGILRAGRKGLVNIVEEMGTVERLLVREDFEGALSFCDQQITGYQSQLDDLFRRLSVSKPVFAGFKKRRKGRIRFLQ